MGMWTEFVGRPFARAGTIFHELGHNLGLNHGGNPTLWGRKVALNTTSTPASATYFEPNCKPNYQSSMSYLFQVHGLFSTNVNAADEMHLDFSGTIHSPMNESSELERRRTRSAAKLSAHLVCPIRQSARAAARCVASHEVLQRQ